MTQKDVNSRSWSGNIRNWLNSKGELQERLPAGWFAPPSKNIEMKQVSRAFFKEVQFHNVGGTDKPCMTPPKPAITYKLPEHKVCLPFLGEFYKWLKKRMQQYTQNKIWYILDPYHQKFVLTPSEMVDGEEWVIPPYPDGEYQAFVVKNVKHGLFIHPWARTLCFFGTAMHIREAESKILQLLQKSTIIHRYP